MKGRHRSMANNKGIVNSRSRKGGSSLNNSGISSQIMSKRGIVGGSGNVLDIDGTDLDVNIQKSDNRHRSQAKVSKLPHLMGKKDVKSSLLQHQRITMEEKTNIVTDQV